MTEYGEEFTLVMKDGTRYLLEPKCVKVVYDGQGRVTGYEYDGPAIEKEDQLTTGESEHAQ